MSDTVLAQFSDALSALVAQAQNFTAEIHVPGRRPLSGLLWGANTVVTSEQALPDAPEYAVRVADKSVRAQLVGRDEGTNVAVLRLQGELSAPLPEPAVARPGALAVLVGSRDGITARLGVVRSVGDSWESLAGGTIDRRIVLDVRIGREEGGPVLAADGRLLGMATRGARRQSLVIPASTVAAAVATLIEKGKVERGWLGVAVRPVVLPEALRPNAGQHVGLMVMDVSADSPGAKSGILAGDVLLTVAGKPATRLGVVSRQLGPNSIGKQLEITLARAGATLAVHATIEPRKAA